MTPGSDTGRAPFCARLHPQIRASFLGVVKLMPCQNSLLSMLPLKDRDHLLALCADVELECGDVLYEDGAALRYAYFPVSGMVSLLARFDGGTLLEVGLIGREGMVGEPLVLGITVAPWSGHVQAHGRAWRISAKALFKEMHTSLPLQGLLRSFVAMRMAQLVEAAGCLRFHQIGPRLARRLLMTLDRGDSSYMKITHETLARTLGVRRVGVTTAAGELQRLGLIEYHHGDLHLLDRAGLEAAACACYEVDCKSYEALVGTA